MAIELVSKDGRALLVISGKLAEVEHGDGYTMACDGERIMPKVADMLDRPIQASARWWLSDKPLDDAEARVKVQIDHAVGNLVALYEQAFSEITGYLWTDQELKLGGHDLVPIFEANAGRYIWMEIEFGGPP